MYCDFNFVKTFLPGKQLVELTTSSGQNVDMQVFNQVHSHSFEELNYIFQKDYVVPFPTLSSLNDYSYQLKEAHARLTIYHLHERARKGDRNFELQRLKDETYKLIYSLLERGFNDYQRISEIEVSSSMTSSFIAIKSDDKNSKLKFVLNKIEL